MFLVGTTEAAYRLEDAMDLRQALLDAGACYFNLMVLVLHVAEWYGEKIRVKLGGASDQLVILDIFCAGEPSGANFQCASTRAVLRVSKDNDLDVSKGSNVPGNRLIGVA